MVSQDHATTVRDGREDAPTPAEIAAKATGLRPDQVMRVVEQYREACSAVESEPEWTAQTHMSGRNWGLAGYVAEGTTIMLNVESWKERGQWQSGRSFSYKGKVYPEYGEARSLELRDTARPTAYLVSDGASSRPLAEPDAVPRNEVERRDNPSTTPDATDGETP